MFSIRATLKAILLAHREKETSWSLSVELHRLRDEISMVIVPRCWLDEKVEFDVRIELEACVQIDVSKARIFVSFRCGLFVAFSGDLVRLVKRYLFYRNLAMVIIFRYIV